MIVVVVVVMVVYSSGCSGNCDSSGNSSSSSSSSSGNGDTTSSSRTNSYLLLLVVSPWRVPSSDNCLHNSWTKSSLLYRYIQNNYHCMYIQYVWLYIVFCILMCFLILSGAGSFFTER